MCGRTVCNQAPECICRASGSRTKGGKWSQPTWRDPPGGQKYYPSYNQAPTSYTPILISKKHLTPEEIESCSDLCDIETPMTDDEGCPLVREDSDYVIQPMYWGLVPSWHQGDTKSTGYNMINARSDGMLSKRTFKGPLEKGRRCVALIDGYYEWQTKGDDKQPYYIYNHTKVKDQVKDEDQGELKVKTEIKLEDKDNRPLLMVAGLFDIWKNKEGEPLYSFSMITVDAHKDMEWLHHRMPALLQTDNDVSAWLDFSEVPLNKAVDVIHPVTDLGHHPVGKAVGNVLNKTADLITPVDPKNLKPKPTKSSNFMSAWLNKGTAKVIKTETQRKRSASESDKITVKAEVNVKSEVKEEGDKPSPTKKPKLE